MSIFACGCGKTFSSKLNYDAHKERCLHVYLTDNYPDELIIIAGGFDEAFIGIDYNTRRAIYSNAKCIDKLVKEGMSLEEAEEYFEFNVAGAYVGERTPIWCNDILTPIK